jgi:hypothetical protein
MEHHCDSVQSVVINVVLLNALEHIIGRAQQNDRRVTTTLENIITEERTQLIGFANELGMPTHSAL